MRWLWTLKEVLIVSMHGVEIDTSLFCDGTGGSFTVYFQHINIFLNHKNASPKVEDIGRRSFMQYPFQQFGGVVLVWNLLNLAYDEEQQNIVSLPLYTGYR